MKDRVSEKAAESDAGVENSETFRNDGKLPEQKSRKKKGAVGGNLHAARRLQQIAELLSTGPACAHRSQAVLVSLIVVASYCHKFAAC